MSRPANIIIEGRAYRWRDILELRPPAGCRVESGKAGSTGLVSADRGRPTEIRAHRRRSLCRAILARLLAADHGAVRPQKRQCPMI